MSNCNECGMHVEEDEYHPFAACLMFKGCKNSVTVRANLNAIRENVVVANLSGLIAEYEAAGSDASWGSGHPIFLMAQENDRWRHINPEPIGFVDSEGAPVLDRKIKGGYLYWGHAPKC